MAGLSNDSLAGFGDLLSLFFRGTHIPVSVFSGGRLLDRYAGDTRDLNFPLFLQNDLPPDLPHVWFASLGSELIFCGISDTDRGLLVFLGPVLSFLCTRTHALRLLNMLSRMEADVVTLMNYFNDIGPHTAENLTAALLMLVRLGWPEYSQEEVTTVPFSWTPPFKRAPVRETDGSHQNDYNLEKRLLSYLRHGRTEPFEQMLEDLPGFLGMSQLPPNPIFRSYIISALTVASRAAISAGVDYDLAYSMLQEYLEALAAEPDLRKAGRFYPQAFLDFAREVASVRQVQTNNPLVRSVIRYVRGHLTEKLSSGQIAASLGYNTSYLCAQFKKEMGKTISSYINECKIDEARLLLEIGRDSMTDIAVRLGYPSQSYFCSVFKDVTGMTPREYRDKAQQEVM